MPSPVPDQISMQGYIPRFRKALIVSVKIFLMVYFFHIIHENLTILGMGEYNYI